MASSCCPGVTYDPGVDGAVGDAADGRRDDLAVGEVDRGRRRLRLRRLDCGAVGADLRRARLQLRLGLTHRLYCRVAPAAGRFDRLNGGVDLLPGDRRGLGPLQRAVASEVGLRLVEVGLRLDHLGLGGGDLLPLDADLGKALGHGGAALLRARQLPLIARPVRGGVEDRQHLSRPDDLVIVDQHLPDQPRDLRRDADDVAVDIGIVGRFVLPRVEPVEQAADDRGDEHDGDDDQQDRTVAQALRRRLVAFAVAVRLVFAVLLRRPWPSPRRLYPADPEPARRPWLPPAGRRHIPPAPPGYADRWGLDRRRRSCDGP